MENISLDDIIAELKNVSPENIRRREKVTSRRWEDKEGEIRETFYTWGGYQIPVEDYKVLVEEGSAFYTTSGGRDIRDREGFLGFKIQLLKGKKVVKTFKKADMNVMDIYQEIDEKVREYEEKRRKDNLTYFAEIIGILQGQTPELWKRDVKNWVTIPKNLVGTSYFNESNEFSTEAEGLEFILEERTFKMGDLTSNGVPYPHPFSEPEVNYRLKVLADKKVIGTFEGEDYTPFISSSIEILRGYHEEQQRREQVQSN